MTTIPLSPGPSPASVRGEKNKSRAASSPLTLAGEGPGERAAKKPLGLWMLTALVAGNMIGSGIFLLPASLAHYGSISILAWLLTAAGALFLALVFAKMSLLIPKSGGPYTYCRAGFGNFIGFQVAYNYWIYTWVGTTGIAVAFVGALGVFFPVLITDTLLSFWVKAATIWALTLINILGIRNAGILQLITTILKLVPLVLVGVIGLFFIHPEYLSSFNVSGQATLPALSGAAALTLWAFTGLESATVPAEEAVNPKTVARATILGTVLTAIVYILGTIAIMGIIPAPILAKSTAPYADAAKIILGPMGGWIVAAGVVIASFGALNGWILIQGQVPLAAAKDKLFPMIFTKQSRFKTPIVSLVISSVLITALLALTLDNHLVEQFTFIVLLATLAALLTYFLTAMAEIMFFIKNREQFQGQRLFKSVLIASIAGLYSFWAIAGTGHTLVFYGMLLFLSGVPIYAWMQRQHPADEEDSEYTYQHAKQ